MADYITTHSGLHFVPTAPEADMVRIEDIAHALSLICRGNGHVKTFFSVGQHCINCAREAQARGCTDRVVLACLLHDAAESYMSDVPRPFKKYLDRYLEFEDTILDVIYTKYLGTTVTEEEQRQIKQIDDALLYYDLLYLLDEPSSCAAPVLRTELSYDVRPFAEVEKEYLHMFETYAVKVRQ